MNTPAPVSGRITLLLLCVYLAFFAALFVSCGGAIWTVERYMDSTPADWPYPGSFLDRVNDIACVLIMLPSSAAGRLLIALIFFTIPIMIEFQKGARWRAFIYAVCIVMPTHIRFLYGNSAYGYTAYLCVLLFVTPSLIHSWAKLSTRPAEKRLMLANLYLLWIIFCAGDLLLGLGMHAGYCKFGLNVLVN